MGVHMLPPDGRNPETPREGPPPSLQHADSDVEDRRSFFRTSFLGVGAGAAAAYAYGRPDHTPIIITPEELFGEEDALEDHPLLDPVEQAEQFAAFLRHLRTPQDHPLPPALAAGSVLTTPRTPQEAEQPARRKFLKAGLLGGGIAVGALAAGGTRMLMTGTADTPAGAQEPRAAAPVSTRRSVARRSTRPERIPGRAQEYGDALIYIDSVYRTKVWERMCREYLSMLRKKDVETWRRQVEETDAEKMRTSFPAEYTAYAGVFTARPVEGLPAEAVVSKKHEFGIFAFTPHRFVSTGKLLPEKYRDRKYLLICTSVPSEKNNPYSVFFSKYLKDAPPAQVRDFVDWCKNHW